MSEIRKNFYEWIIKQRYEIIKEIHAKIHEKP